MALKIATQAQTCVMEDTGAYHEIDALIEEGIKPDGEQARLAYRVMDVLKDACRRNEAAAKEELRRSLEQAVCSRMEDLAKHLIQYSARYKRRHGWDTLNKMIFNDNVPLVEQCFFYRKRKKKSGR